MKPLIDLRRVEKTYLAKRQAIIALRSISLQVKQGEFLAITGESGSGKSTMLRIIGALEKPTSGQVIIDGHDVSKFSDHELSKLRNEKIGFVFQSFNLQPFLSVLDNVSTPAIFAGSPLKLSRDRAKQLLESVGLGDKASSLPGELSGGQMQRVAICRSVINRPSILLADEPTGNLDSVNSRVIYDLFREINRRLSTTIVIVTHSQNMANHADRIIRLRDGEIIGDVDRWEDGE